MKRNQESVEGAAQAMITRLVRLQQADRHISTWAGCIADQSINDDERNRMLTTFRGQLKRGAEGADGERGAIKREKLAQFPTVKFKAESYAVAWKDWPQDDELKKQIRKEWQAGGIGRPVIQSRGIRQGTDRGYASPATKDCRSRTSRGNTAGQCRRYVNRCT